MQKNWIDANNILDKATFTQLEALCIQQEPPSCSASCPFHADIRTICKHVANHNFKQAFKSYQKSVPFARIIAATCNAPCQETCKRIECGGNILIQKIEKFISDTEGTLEKIPLIIPKKNKKVAIIGGNMAGLSAALQFSKKGYNATIFEKTDQLWMDIRHFFSALELDDLLEKETNHLLKYKNISVQYNYFQPVGSIHDVEPLQAEFDAIYIACSSPLNADIQTNTQQVNGAEHIFSGSCNLQNRITTGYSSVYEAYDGRSAAYSIDRYFQKVNLEEGRQKEGSYITNLYVSLEDVEDKPAPLETTIFNEQTVIKEAARCLQCECLECVKKCAFLKHYKSNPSHYVREVKNNLSIALGNHTANTMINSCALCSQCEAVCPNGLDMQQVFLAARERMVQTKKMPPSAFEFALQDMNYSLSGTAYLLRHQSGYTSSQYIFFPGCQLSASEPTLVKTVYQDLCNQLEGGVGIWLACCGIMAQWAGQKEIFVSVKERFIKEWKKMGQPTLITACPSCQLTFNKQMEITTVSLYSFLKANTARTSAFITHSKPATLHHACGARYNTELQQTVQTLCLDTGITLRQEKQSQENKSPCCGYGGLISFSNQQIASEVTDKAIQMLTNERKDTAIISYCINCRDRYLEKGQNAWHILELLYPDEYNHRAPNISERQENRAFLKNKLLQELWKEEVALEQEIVLHISSELEKKLNSEHILHSDITEAILYAEKNNDKLLDKKTGHFKAQYRPKNVTFWVEYLSCPDGSFNVFTAYSYRMQVQVKTSDFKGEIGE